MRIRVEKPAKIMGKSQDTTAARRMVPDQPDAPAGVRAVSCRRSGAVEGLLHRYKLQTSGKYLSHGSGPL
jgi:hypothetical protein